MTTLSTHVLDIEHGLPAIGVPIQLYRDDRPVATGVTDSDGRIPNVNASPLEPGTYRLVFDVATYFALANRAAPFLQRITIEFEVHAGDPHYHVPLLVSPYACTSYRGS